MARTRPSIDEPEDSTPLTVLLTNNTIKNLAGTERYVQSVCRHLIENRHTPIIYSTQFGAAAAQLRELGIIVVNDLQQITITPDIIHGHHHLDLACALAHFPQTPCIAFIHGVIPWEERSFPDIPRIRRHIAVSQTTALSACTQSIPPEKIVRLANFVERQRFDAWYRRRGIRTAQGQCRALIFGNYRQAAEPLIRNLCQELGIALDCHGSCYGGSVAEPERLFPNYDLVFAYGKSAMEALCSGCHVILSSQHGLGPLVSTDNFDHLREHNFGYSVSFSPPTPESLRSATRTALERRHRGIPPLNENCIRSLHADTILPRLIALYRTAIREWRMQRANQDLSAEMQAFSRYFRFLQISRFEGLDAHHSRLESLERQAAQLEQARLELALTLQELKSRPLVWMLRRLRQRWSGGSGSAAGFVSTAGQVPPFGTQQVPSA